MEGKDTLFNGRDSKLNHLQASEILSYRAGSGEGKHLYFEQKGKGLLVLEGKAQGVIRQVNPEELGSWCKRGETLDPREGMVLREMDLKEIEAVIAKEFQASSNPNGGEGKREEKKEVGGCGERVFLYTEKKRKHFLVDQ